MKNWMKLMVTAVMVLGAEAANAGVQVVHYDVEDKPLKAAVSGTVLSFELYEDSACTSMVAFDSIAIDDVKVSRLKRFVPSGAAKPPKTDTMEATMDGAPSAAYLKVTGTGVTPVGGACQAQIASPSGKVVAVASMAGISGSVPIGGSEFAFVGAVTSIGTSDGETLIASAHAALGGVGGAKTVTLGVCYVNSFLGGSLVNFAGSFGGPTTVAGSVLEMHTYSAAGSTVPGAGFWDVGLCVKSGTAGFIQHDAGSGFAMAVR